MKTLNIVLLAAVLACVPVLALLAAPERPTEKPLNEMTIEELLILLEKGDGNQTEAFDMFINRLKPLAPRINRVMITYRGYGLEDGLILKFQPLNRSDLLVVPLGPAIMSQMGVKGVIVHGTEGGMAQSGLKMYDIITAVNGTAITNVENFNKALSACPPDSESEFKIIRGGEEKTLKFVVPPPPPPPTDRAPY